MEFFPLCKVGLYHLERLIFYLERHKRLFEAIWSNKQNIKKWLIFDQNHGQTPQKKNANFCHFLSSIFLWCRKPIFLSRTSWKTFLGILNFVLTNTKLQRFLIFHQNHGLTPYQKWKLCHFLIRYFYHLERLTFYLEHREILFRVSVI